MMNLLGLGKGPDITILLDGEDEREKADIRNESHGRMEKYPLYYDGEDVSGKVSIHLKRSDNKIDHQGIKVEFVGVIEFTYDKGSSFDFISIYKELAQPGILTKSTTYDFHFADVRKPYETFAGSNVRLKYLVRVCVVRKFNNHTKSREVIVHTLCTFPNDFSPTNMEVGIDQYLHIEFQFNKQKYHLKDVVIGRVHFQLVRLKIKHMELQVIRKESSALIGNSFGEMDVVGKFEIMDGQPVKGENIPIRMYLGAYLLTPTMRDIYKKFSVRYFLNLLLIDDDDRRYYKQQEITLYRKANMPARPLIQNPEMVAKILGSTVPRHPPQTAPPPASQLSEEDSQGSHSQNGDAGCDYDPEEDVGAPESPGEGDAVVPETEANGEMVVPAVSS